MWERVGNGKKDIRQVGGSKRKVAKRVQKIKSLKQLCKICWKGLYRKRIGKRERGNMPGERV